MTKAFIEIDHLLTAVEDPALAGASWESLGFTVTPISVIEEMGIANRLVLFHPLTPGSANFVELMGIQNPARTPEGMVRLIGGEPGIRSMVLATDDPEYSRATLLGQGRDPGVVHHLERIWSLPTGEELNVAFEVLLPTPAPLVFNACRHLTLHHYLRPEWLNHPNGARSLRAVNCVSEDPARMVAPYEDMFGQRAKAGPSGALTVSPGHVQLRIFEPRFFRRTFESDPPVTEGYVGMTIQVADLDHCAGVMAGAARPLTDGGLIVGADRATGNILHLIS